VDEQQALAAGVPVNDESFARQVPVPLKYSPDAYLHPDEHSFPLSPTTFLNHSKLMWKA
jgi:hypothetical protein